MRKLWRFWPAAVLVAAVLLPACGGGSSSPNPVTTTTTLPPRDAVVVLNGQVGGKFQFSSTPSRLNRGTSFGCGDASITVPYRETGGGSAVGADYEVRVLDVQGFQSRDVGKATNITINPNESGVITFTERFICVEFSDAQPPRGQVALNFGSKATGKVSQLAGTGDLTPSF